MLDYRNGVKKLLKETKKLMVKPLEIVYDKSDLISALNSLKVYFDGDDIQRMHFGYQAEIIENAFDYLLSRLEISESERFKFWLNS